MTTSYQVEALNLYDTISIKGIRSLLAGKVIDSNPQELQLQYGENSYLFIYRFGCLVFFNVPKETREAEIAKLKAALGPGLENPTTENYIVNIADGPNKVEFEYVELKKLTLDQIRLISVSVGQSAAIEYFEAQTERMLADTTKFMNDLARGRSQSVLNSGKEHLKIIGSAASTRQHILSNLAVLDPPDETWKSKELGKLFAEVQENFDIDMRFRTMDRKLSLIQDNIEILADLNKSRRSLWLEAAIVILIVVEIVLAFFVH